jgi:hypothetical protein
VDSLIFALRIAASLLLLAFLGLVFAMLWRDYQMAAREVESRTRQRGRLLVISAGDSPFKIGSSFPLRPLTSIGRAANNTLRLNDAFTSSEHALIALRGDQWWLEDRQSSNGTYLNNYRIEESVVLSSGDLVRIGQLELKIELD